MNKLYFKDIFLSVITLPVFISACSERKDVDQDIQPNVIIILTDDMGYGDIGYHGNPFIRTPNLDRLAAESTQFSNFYVSPVCAPTRASLLTGRYSLRTGIYDTYAGGAIMKTEEVTLAEELKSKGYATACIGKWHLGENYPFRPTDQGFDYSLVHLSGGLEQPGDFYENFIRKDSSYFDPWVEIKNHKVQLKGYCTDAFTTKAMEFIDENKSDPFFLYLSYNAPHTPLEVPNEYLDFYRNMEYQIDTFNIDGHNEFEKLSEKDLEAARRVYAMMTNIDDNVGRLRKFLQENNLHENTLIIFMSDNGPQQPRYKSGLYGRKGSVYEGGIKVPFFWYFPGDNNTVRKIEKPFAHIDVLPTILDLVDKNATNSLDGISMLPYINDTNATQPSRKLFFQWQRGFPELFQNAAVRDDTFKLVSPLEYDDTTFQLFNIVADPYEKNDLSSQYPDKTKELKQSYVQWYKENMADLSDGYPYEIRIPAPDMNNTRLGRNEWKGPHTQFWSKMEANGYWDLEVMNPGHYSFRLFFQDTLPGHGLMKMRIGTNDRVKKVAHEYKQVWEFDSIYLNPGIYRLDSWFYCYWPQWEIYGPYAVDIFFNE